MRRPDDATPDPAEPHRPGRNAVSVAMLAAVACVPIVVATGFLTDRAPGRDAGGAPVGDTTAAVPGDISVLALRGDLDAAAERRPHPPMRAGY